MNREKANELPMMQVGFIDSICFPIYQVSTRQFFVVLRNVKTKFGFLRKMSASLYQSSFQC